VGDGHIGKEAGEGCTKSARSIALNDEEVGRIGKPRQKRGGYRADVPVRILLAGAMQPLLAITREAEMLRIKSGVLAGKDERRRKPARGERVSNRCKLDCLGPGADDQPDIREIQPSP